MSDLNRNVLNYIHNGMINSCNSLKRNIDCFCGTFMIVCWWCEMYSDHDLGTPFDCYYWIPWQQLCNPECKGVLS